MASHTTTKDAVQSGWYPILKELEDLFLRRICGYYCPYLDPHPNHLSKLITGVGAEAEEKLILLPKTVLLVDRRFLSLAEPASLHGPVSALCCNS